MDKRDSRLIEAGDLPAALGLLTRLPVRVDGDRAAARGAAAAWAWPLVGLPVALLACLAGQLALWVGTSPAVAAGLALATGIAVTGGMHEDGLADSADGLWGGWTVARRLEIMKDSRIGTYGVLALILATGLRWAALTPLVAAGNLWPALIATAVISRLPMVVLMGALPPARATGLGASVGQPSARTAALAGLLTLAAALPFVGLRVVPVGLAVLLATGTLGLIARARLGGQTGDILGASQQVAEVTTLIVLAA